jgi:hypothetical protein
MSPFKKILSIILLALAISLLTGWAADKASRRFWDPFLAKMDIAFTDTSNYQVVFLGNSTVHFGINPRYADSVTGLKTFNLGYGGANIATIKALFEGYLEVHPRPKLIVLSLERSSLMEEADFSNSFLLFGYIQRDAVNHYLQEKGYHTGLIHAFPFLKYSYADEYNRTCIVKGFSGSPFEKEAIIYKGFINNQHNVFAAGVMDEAEANAPALSAKLTDSLGSLLSRCNKEGIKVLIVFPPRIYQNKQGIFAGTNTPDSLPSNIATRYQLPYRRFDLPGLFDLHEFSDNMHLNVEGAKHYSIVIGNAVDSVL